MAQDPSPAPAVEVAVEQESIPADHVPTLAELEAAGARIGEIRVADRGYLRPQRPEGEQLPLSAGEQAAHQHPPRCDPAAAAVPDRRAALGARDRGDRAAAARKALPLRREHPADRLPRRRGGYRSQDARYLVARHRHQREPGRRREQGPRVGQGGEPSRHRHPARALLQLRRRPQRHHVRDRRHQPLRHARHRRLFVHQLRRRRQPGVLAAAAVLRSGRPLGSRAQRLRERSSSMRSTTRATPSPSIATGGRRAKSSAAGRRA